MLHGLCQDDLMVGVCRLCKPDLWRREVVDWYTVDVHLPATGPEKAFRGW